MFHNMSRRGIIRFFSYNLAIIASLAILLGISNYHADFYKTQQSIQYQHSLDELDEYLGNIETSLNKGIYANTAPMVSNMSAKLLKEASGAKGALSLLPVSDMNLENIYKFLSQVGEFSLSLSNKLNHNQEITEEEHALVRQLADQAKNLAEQLSVIRRTFRAEDLVEEQLRQGNSQDGEMQVSALGGFSDAEESIVDFPTLIYDGPFSDHILQREPLLLQNEKEISREEAKEIAAKFCQVRPDLLADEKDEGGVMPSYRFKTDVIDISITKLGGHVTYLLDSSYCDEITMTLEEAVERAKQAMLDRGLDSFQETYYMEEDGICVVNFAYTENDVTYYTDLIKIGICMDNGDVVFYDARGYIMNHSARTLPEKKYTIEQAQDALSPYLEVLSEGEAVIPTGGQNEMYCYEFHCQGEDEEVLVYINVETCTETDILLLLYSDDGVFTM